MTFYESIVDGSLEPDPEHMTWDYEGVVIVKAGVVIIIVSVIVGIVSLFFCAWQYCRDGRSNAEHEESQERVNQTEEDTVISLSYIYLPGYRQPPYASNYVSVWSSSDRDDTCIPGLPDYASASSPCPSYGPPESRQNSES